MRLPRRFSIAGLMAVVLVVSFSLAALHSGSATWAGGLSLLTYGALALAVVGAACRGPSERAWWLGFALFGFGYLKWAYWDGDGMGKLPTMALLEFLMPAAVPAPILPGTHPPRYGPLMDGRPAYYWTVGHCLWSLLAATLGGVLAHALFAAPALDRDAGPSRESRPARARWRRVAAVGLAGLGTCTALVLVGLRSDPALWAGAVYFLTWGLLGTAALGAVCRRGKQRMIWCGAALFGLGYMVLTRIPDYPDSTVLGRSAVHLVADQFLIAVRPWLPPIVSGFPAETAAAANANARVWKALEQPVPMTFRDPTPLEDILRYIRAATQAKDSPEITIYVDPTALQEAEKTMQSPIQIDIEGQPLNATLRLALEQLGMVHYVRDGVLSITTPNRDGPPVVIDYYLLLGHCVLALLAAGLGALVVPLVAERRAVETSPNGV